MDNQNSDFLESLRSGNVEVDTIAVHPLTWEQLQEIMPIRDSLFGLSAVGGIFSKSPVRISSLVPEGQAWLHTRGTTVIIELC